MVSTRAFDRMFMMVNSSVVRRLLFEDYLCLRNTIRLTPSRDSNQPRGSNYFDRRWIVHFFRHLALSIRTDILRTRGHQRLQGHIVRKETNYGFSNAEST